jgi:hypothetical protein
MALLSSDVSYDLQTWSRVHPRLHYHRLMLCGSMPPMNTCSTLENSEEKRLIETTEI